MRLQENHGLQNSPWGGGGKPYLAFGLTRSTCDISKLGRAKRIWYLSPMRAAKVQASLRIRAVSPEPSLLAHTSSESRGTFRQKARSLAPLNVWTCAVKICHDGLLEDTNSLDGAQFRKKYIRMGITVNEPRQAKMCLREFATR